MSRIAVLYIFFCLFAAPVLAQDTDPTRHPEQEYIIGWGNEVIFPQAIRFSVVIGSTAADLAMATLTIQPEGQPALVINVDIEEAAIIAEPYTELAYIWEIPTTDPPRLFQEIGIEWRVVTNQNENARIEDSFVFTDQRTEWVQDEDPQNAIDLTLPIDGPNPTRIRRDLMPVYDLLTVNVGRAPSFNLILYTSEFPIGCTTNEDRDSVAVGPISGTEVDCNLTKAETIFSASGYDAIQPDPNITSPIVARLTEGFYETIWLDKDVPDWFRAGLARFYSPLPKTSLLPMALVAARNDRLFTLEELDVMPLNDEVGQAQSYGMVLYIASQIGVDGLFGLASDLAAAASFEAAYQTRVGQPLDNLIADWERWIFTDEAASAYVYTLYLASTPTPTPSPSLTPFPPTETPTPTLTPTVTPTPTVTGVLSDTPAPTRTLTRTPTAAPATITPRPAGSLNTPTPTVVTTIQASSDVNRIGLVALILLGLAIIGLIYLRFGRRR
jgi:hypothetical protein